MKLFLDETSKNYSYVAKVRQAFQNLQLLILKFKFFEKEELNEDMAARVEHDFRMLCDLL